MRIYSDSDVPTFNALRPVVVKAAMLKTWRRKCTQCSWALNIVDYLQPQLKHIPCPKCGAVTNLIER